jgi:hypothetical protein
VVGEDTHLTGGGGNVDLGTVIAQGSSVIFQGAAEADATGTETHTPVER